MHEPERVLARADALDQRRPRVPVHRAPDHQRPPTDAARNIAPQPLAELGQLETAALPLIQNANRRKSTQQPIQRIGVRLRLGCKIVARTSTSGQPIGNAEPRSNMQRLRHLIARDEPEQRTTRIAFHAADRTREQRLSFCVRHDDRPNGGRSRRARALAACPATRV